MIRSRGKMTKRRNQNEHNAYNRGFDAGARRIVIAWKGGKCAECGETDLKKLEIAHIIPVKRQYRHYTDWLDPGNIRILCQRCNQREENGQRNKV